MSPVTASFTLSNGRSMQIVGSNQDVISFINQMEETHTNRPGPGRHVGFSPKKLGRPKKAQDTNETAT